MFIFPPILTNLGLNQWNKLDVLVSHIHNIENIPLEEIMAPVFLGFPWWLSGKESAYNAGNLGLIPELGRSPAGGHGNPLQYSCLENSMDRGSWQATYIQFSSVAQSCPTLCKPMNHSTPGLPVHHQLLEFTQTHVHRVSDAIQPSHPLSSPSPLAPTPSQHQGLFQWVNSSPEVAKGLEFQLQHQSFQWTPRTDL